MIMLLLCTLALAQNTREVQVTVQDPQRQVQGSLQATIQGAQGSNQSITLKDDGVSPDHTQHDGIFSAVTRFSDTTVHLELDAGGRKWTADAMLPDPDRDTVLRLQLGPEETAVVLQGSRGMLGGPGPSTNSSSGSVWIWAVLLAAVGFGAGAAGRWGLVRAPNRARTSGEIARADIAPRRFGADELEKVIASLDGHSIFVLGPANDESSVIRFTQSRVTPDAVIRSIEEATAGAAPPPALVVTNPAALELPLRTTAPQALSKAVARRFALYLVDGPTDWAGPA